jgi:hypothetical protein
MKDTLEILWKEKMSYSSAFLLLAKFRQKAKLNFWKGSDVWGFQEVRKTVLKWLDSYIWFSLGS